MGKLERAIIYTLPGDGSADSGGAPLEVCFNPKEFSVSRDGGTWDTKNAFSDDPPAEFTKAFTSTMSVTLQFDTYESGGSVKANYVDQLTAMTMLREPLPAGASTTEKSRPPVILFTWGSFKFKGVVTKLDSKYTMFLSNGTPVRAECQLSILHVGKSQSASGGGGSSGQTVQVQQNDRIDSIAAQQSGGDGSNWKDIAEANNINNPATMTNDNGERVTSLNMPPRR